MLFHIQISMRTWTISSDTNTQLIACVLRTMKNACASAHFRFAQVFHTNNFWLKCRNSISTGWQLVVIVPTHVCVSTCMRTEWPNRTRDRWIESLTNLNWNLIRKKFSERNSCTFLAFSLPWFNELIWQKQKERKKKNGNIDEWVTVLGWSWNEFN